MGYKFEAICDRCGRKVSHDEFIYTIKVDLDETWNNPLSVVAKNLGELINVNSKPPETKTYCQECIDQLKKDYNL